MELLGFLGRSTYRRPWNLDPGSPCWDDAKDAFSLVVGADPDSIRGWRNPDAEGRRSRFPKTRDRRSRPFIVTVNALDRGDAGFYHSRGTCE